jgi:urease accessory protein
MRAGENIAPGATLLLVLKHPDETNDWLLWQLADSAFPTGGFAHSGGLEAACQHGEIRGADDLASYLQTCLWQTVSSMIPFVTAGHSAPDQLMKSNLGCEVFLSNHVANRASRLQGRAFLNSATRIFDAATSFPAISDPCHLAPTFGTVTRLLLIARSTAEHLFIFSNLRSVAAAAVRLGIVGPMEAQAILHRLAPRAREILTLMEGRGVDEVAATSPLLEIWQGSHDRLYSRLFQT